MIINYTGIILRRIILYMSLLFSSWPPFSSEKKKKNKKQYLPNHSSLFVAKRWLEWTDRSQMMEKNMITNETENDENEKEEEEILSGKAKTKWANCASGRNEK